MVDYTLFLVIPLMVILGESTRRFLLEPDAHRFVKRHGERLMRGMFWGLLFFAAFWDYAEKSALWSFAPLCVLVGGVLVYSLMLRYIERRDPEFAAAYSSRFAR